MTSNRGQQEYPKVAKRSLTCRAGATPGFAYILLLASIAVLAVVSSASVTIGMQFARRSAEQQLLIIGAEFERALRSYQTAAGGGPLSGPRELDDLLRDPRRPGVVRHLRKVYADPLTGKAEWGLVRGPNGVIVGIYSLAEGEPAKRSGFDAWQAHFEDAQRYADWVFQGATPMPTSRGVR